MAIRVYLCDDVPALRLVLRTVLELDADIVVVGESGDGRTALEDLARLRPDVLVLDLSLPELDGLEVLDELGAFGSGIIVPRVEVDFAREVVDGELVIDIDVLKVGRTSFRLRHLVQQAGLTAATVEVVIVSYGYDDRGPLELTDEQRTLLEGHLLL